MFHSKFQEVLDHFNYIEGTKAKCIGSYMLNFVVSGLSSDQLSRLELAYRYNPERHIGAGVIGEERYNSMNNNSGYTLNKGYVPKEGDYLSSEDWTDDQIKWLANNTPESWWCCDIGRKETGFNGYGYLQWHNEYFVTSIAFPLKNRRITPDMVVFLAGSVHVESITGTLTFEDNSPLLQPSPRSKKVLVADLSKDLYNILDGHLTHGKMYECFTDRSMGGFEIVNDSGARDRYGKWWFKEVYLYDEDEAELTCRDIEFKEDDYIDLRKHTPEQIRHISKFYPVYELEETLAEYHDWSLLYWDGMDCAFVACSSVDINPTKEYTYDDIFYLEN